MLPALTFILALLTFAGGICWLSQRELQTIAAKRAAERAALEQAKLDAWAKERLKEFNRKNRWKPSQALVPNKGTVWNPLRNYPRNMACFCGSAKKAKACCLPKLSPTIAESRAKAAEHLVHLAKQGKSVAALLARHEAAL